MSEYGVRRLMALFHLYEAFPHHPEFVRQSALPLIKAELTAFLQRLTQMDSIAIYQFQNQARHMYYDATARREFTVVQGFSMDVPTAQNKRNSVLISWNLFFYPNVSHSMEIPLEYQTMCQLDDTLSLAHGRIQTATNFLQENSSK